MKKDVFKEDTKDDFVAGQKATFPLIIKENGINYATYLDDGWMTGIFLDQRDVRRRISEDYSVSKNVLNTFSYTGAFSVAALFGGASKNDKRRCGWSFAQQDKRTIRSKWS